MAWPVVLTVLQAVRARTDTTTPTVARNGRVRSLRQVDGLRAVEKIFLKVIFNQCFTDF
jgi:hypothetical protein